MDIIIGNSTELIKQAHAIRYQVFTVEQKIPRTLDLDGLDPISSHALVTKQGALVATARLTVNDDGSAVMARVAVIQAYRGQGVAAKVVTALIEHAREMGITAIKIHAHDYLRNYYERYGFTFIQAVEIVGGHQLIAMQYQIDPA
ncbi:GNAT family N-acetyltransferase [Rheinheimera salexigens]|uniref:GNAT family N-acetyltransferase n=1 Tax=Rheinheimera salexigens TaxID=1628148 RepID=A0A1E7Q5K5_9GAMM|nr:GNAT family N-acetyltransferase [Rheinheimera salexigens]OEY69426.1 GNAT family N-acetyltransferase [Rheinheimera salexigens]